jgi:hypothetical protein
MQDTLGPERFDGLGEGEAAMKAEPFACVAMSPDVEAVGPDPVEAGEGSIELLAAIVREAGAVALGLSRYRNDDAKRDCCAKLQAAAATSRHVLIAAARRTRCV